MPVTIHPAAHRANILPPLPQYDDTSKAILSFCSRKEYANCESIIQSSFQHPSDIRPSSHSFIKAAILAYNKHHNLIIRPDDIWLAILTQFSIYVNANAEKLRHLFVAHEGQKELEIREKDQTTATYDFARFPQKMSHLMEKNIKDPRLRTWIMPDFTTTTDTDKVVCSVVMMATLQKYFSYKLCLECGIPSVTLLGERRDYENIMKRLEKLLSFGEETGEWSQLLK